MNKPIHAHATAAIFLALLSNSRISAAQCTAERTADLLRRLREPATASDREVKVDCDLTLRRGERITKRIVLEGSAASGVTLDCNRAVLDGGPSNPPNHHRDMIEVRSRRTAAGGRYSWDPPSNITIRNCTVRGSIRIWGMGRNGEAEHVRASSRRDDNHVYRLRSAAPRRITLDRMTITAQGIRTPFYISPGVMFVTLSNSEVTGRSESVGVYLDTESYGNTLRNNSFHVTSRKEYALGAYTRKREEMAIDNSSNNTIINNRFSTLEGGGIYIYRNCGEGGTVRHSTPSHNKIINNVFYYRRYKGTNPAVYLGSRTDNWWRLYCDDDEGFPWGSSRDDRSFARHNIVMQNQLHQRLIFDMLLRRYRPARIDDMIKLGDSTNRPNSVDHNQLVTPDTVETRQAGCYVANGYQTDFIAHGESVDLYRGPDGGPSCGYKFGCNDSQLTYESALSSSCRVQRVPFECRVSGDNNGCRRYAFCPRDTTAVGAKAGCNLEYGAVSESALASVPESSIKVLRESDDRSDGRCYVGATTLRRGQRRIEGLSGRSAVVGCREHDRNGGDCHIRGALYCYSSGPRTPSFLLPSLGSTLLR